MPESIHAPNLWRRAAASSVTSRLLDSVRRRRTLLDGGLSSSARDAQTREDAEARTLSIVRSSGLVRMMDGLLTMVIVAWRNSALVALSSRQIVDRAGAGWPPESVWPAAS